MKNRCLPSAALVGFIMVGAATASAPVSEHAFRDIKWMEGRWLAKIEEPGELPRTVQSTFGLDADATKLTTTFTVTRLWQVIVQQRDSYEWESSELHRTVDRGGRIEKIPVVLERSENVFRLMDRDPPTAFVPAGVEYTRKSDDLIIARVLFGPKRKPGSPVVYRRAGLAKP